MKTYRRFIALLFFGIMLQAYAQSGLADNTSHLLESNSIKDELLHLYNTEPQLCHPYFSSNAHIMLELQKMPSSDFWSWIKNYINSYVQQPHFRVTPEKAPHTIAYLKTIAKNMGIDQVPDLYLGQSPWDPYNADAGSSFFEKTGNWLNYLVNSAINYAIVTNVEDEWKLPMLTLRYLVPATVATLLTKCADTADRIVIYDKKTVEAFSENSIRATLAHEAGHIKNNDHAMGNIIWNLSVCVASASTYHAMTNSTTKSFVESLSPNIYNLLNKLTNQFNIDLLKGHDAQEALNNNFILALVMQLFAENLRDLLYSKRSRFIEYRADLEAAHVVGFENMIKDREDQQRLLGQDIERDFALIPSSDHSAAHCLIWLLKKSEQFKEWKESNSPFRSHPTHQQRIDYLRQKQIEAQQASTAR